MGEFKGTYLEHLSGDYTVQDDFRSPKVIHYNSVVCEIRHFFKETERDGEKHSTGLSARQMRFLAETFAESMNVRQQINCSLTELLEQRDELSKHLKSMVSESLKTKQHHKLPDFKKAIEQSEELLTKINKT